MNTQHIREDICWIFSGLLVCLTFPVSIPICIGLDRIQNATIPFYIPSWKKRKMLQLYEEYQKQALQEEATLKTNEYMFSFSSYSMTI